MIYLPTSLGDFVRANVTIPCSAPGGDKRAARRWNGHPAPAEKKKQKKQETTWSLNEENVEKLSSIIIWLVVSTYPSEKYEFVSWDDDIPNIWKVIKAMFQTTNQIIYWIYGKTGDLMWEGCFLYIVRKPLCDSYPAEFVGDFNYEGVMKQPGSIGNGAFSPCQTWDGTDGTAPGWPRGILSLKQQTWGLEHTWTNNMCGINSLM